MVEVSGLEPAGLYVANVSRTDPLTRGKAREPLRDQDGL